MRTIGYARVSTKGQAHDGTSLESQETLLMENGCDFVLADSCSGTNLNRPILQQVLAELTEGDILMVTKLDRLSRNVADGVSLINSLVDRGIIVHVLNIGRIERTPMGTMMLNMLLAFAQFERDCIVERTQEGKQRAKLRPDYVDGRPRALSDERRKYAVSLLKDHTYKEAARLMGISERTMYRYANELDEAFS